MNGQFIFQNRKRLGLTQLDLAKKIGVSYKTILNYEKGGVIPKSKYIIIQKVLGVEFSNNENNIVLEKTLFSEWLQLELDYISNRLMMMKTLGSINGFKNMVYVEFEKLKNYEKAFESINSLYQTLFGAKRFESFEQFAITLK